MNNVVSKATTAKMTMLALANDRCLVTRVDMSNPFRLCRMGRL
ncbi:MAG: hypothetical protein BWY94_00792 [Actinobacteria bacterium ADurb.BinA094]|nr:MAG: hypothetical protein BWY94_00792 [Actinobacteria bacterium ADurb.BinA094]